MCLESAKTRRRKKRKWTNLVKVEKKKTKPTKKTPKTVETIVLHLSLGSSVAAACSQARISTSAYYHWRSSDAKFKEETDIAMASSEAVWVHCLNQMAVNQDTPDNVRFQILKFLLSRRHPHWSENGNVVEIDDSAEHFKAMVEQTN